MNPEQCSCLAYLNQTEGGTPISLCEDTDAIMHFIFTTFLHLEMSRPPQVYPTPHWCPVWQGGNLFPGNPAATPSTSRYESQVTDRLCVLDMIQFVERSIWYLACDVQKCDQWFAETLAGDILPWWLDWVRRKIPPENNNNGEVITIINSSSPASLLTMLAFCLCFQLQGTLSFTLSKRCW